jgi:hypothetical protein
MNKPDMAEYGAEVDKLATLPPATIEIPPVEALALITVVQAGMLSSPGIAQNGFTKIAVAGARKLQSSLFREESEANKMLEYTWNQIASLSRPSADDAVPPSEKTDF